MKRYIQYFLTGKPSPVVITPVSGMDLWYDGQDNVHGFQLSGSNITSWLDKSGNNNTAIPFSAGQYTQLYTDSFKWASGFSNLVFLNTTTNVLFTRTNAMTVFLVVNELGPSVNYGIPFAMGTGSQYFIYQGTTDGPNSYAGSAAITYSGSWTARGFSTWTSQVNSTGTQYLKASGLSQISGGAGILSSPNTFTAIGNYNANNLAFFNGRIAEIIVYTSFLNSTQVLQNQMYLSNKYGVAL